MKSQFGPRVHVELSKPPLILCSCVSITLPAASQTRITASCERLLCIAYPIA
jgi:hypothetical protein